MYYTIEDFNEIIANGLNFFLDNNVVSIINELEILVGTNQQETQMKPVKKYAEKRGFYEKDRKKYSSKEVSGDDWQVVRNFKPTKIETKQGIEKDINDIRVSLNKISSKNYDTYQKIILDDIEKFMTSFTSEEDQKRIVKAVFDIASLNKFYSEIYADLYKQLLLKFPIFDDELKEYISNFKTNFHNITFIDPNTDYDGFCSYTKINDNRKATVTFVCNLVKKDIIQITTVLDLIDYLQDLLDTYINEEQKTNEVEELTENLYIFVTQCYKLFELNDEWETTKNKIIEFSKKSVKDYKSLTSRSVFKYMDILDTIKNS